MNAESAQGSAADRREQILAAASIVFGERGYVGGTTDAIARQAGISQAYVVRMFGGKENLFRAVVERAAHRVAEAFKSAIEQTPDASKTQRRYALGLAYGNLMGDRGILLTLLHLFALGHDDVFGPIARSCFLDAYRIVREEGGMDAVEATDFFSQGMLITVLFAMRMPDAGSDPYAMELMQCAFGDKIHDLIELAHLQVPLEDASRA